MPFGTGYPSDGSQRWYARTIVRKKARRIGGGTRWPFPTITSRWSIISRNSSGRNRSNRAPARLTSCHIRSYCANTSKWRTLTDLVIAPPLRWR